MEDLSTLGNAAVVPIVISVTQLLKKQFRWRRAPETLALGVSLVLCFGWELYNITPEAFGVITQGGFLSMFKWAVGNLIVGFATWLSASKLYDLGYGEKKQKKKLIEAETEKKKLEEEVVKLKNGGVAKDEVQKPTEADDLSTRLLEILEGNE